MKKFILILAVLANQAWAEGMTVRIDGRDYPINTATGFLVQATPDQIKHIQPTTEYRTSGDVVQVHGGYIASGTSSGLASTVITSNGVYSISRSGSTTFVMGGRR